MPTVAKSTSPRMTTVARRSSQRHSTDSGGSLKLPRYETIEKYLTCARLNALNHNISCWWYVPPTYGVVNSKRTKLTDGYPELGQKTINKQIISTGDEGAIDIVREDANV